MSRPARDMAIFFGGPWRQAVSVAVDFDLAKIEDDGGFAPRGPGISSWPDTQDHTA